MVEQGVHQGMLRVTRPRVDHQSGRLIKDDYVLIDMDKIYGYSLSFVVLAGGFRLYINI